MSKSVSDYESKYKADYNSDWKIHQDYIQGFDQYEAMLLSEVWDSVSNSIDGSKMTDSYITTLAKERADRVMAKLPDGVTESVGTADIGKAAFLDILRQKWIYPNANTQHPFLEKLNMWQLYSSVYGYMPMMYDWNVSNTGYVGPDCWLWSPRNLVPQQGKTSLSDMDYVTALTWVNKKYIEGIIEEYGGKEDSAGWDIEALKELLELADKEVDVDTHKDTLTERTRIVQSRKKGICLATRYEAGLDGNWCTFAPDHGFVQVRELPNPHKNGKIPFVIKYSQPLFDSFYGLGDFQRGRGLQFARDGLRNFYFKGIKMNLIPPIVANSNGVLKHTLDYREGAVMLETLPNSIRRLETSPAGLNTYQGAQSDLTGSLLSMFGTQNASLPGAESLNPTQGKTPAAINYYGDKEASRDGSEMRHLEAALEELIDGFNSLIANVGTEDIPVALFADDIKEIVDSGMKDVLELTQPKVDPSGAAISFTINPSVLKGVEYRFRINTNSTAKANQQAEQAKMEMLMTNIGKFQNIFKDDPRVEVNWPAIMESYEKTTGIKGASQFITINPQAPSPHELELQKEQMGNQAPPQPPKPLLNYADAPEDVKRQMEAADGYTPSQAPVTPDHALKAQEQDHKQAVEETKLMLDAHQQDHQQLQDHASLGMQHAQRLDTKEQNQASNQIAEKSAKLKSSKKE